jgi:hypothetical protein
MPKSDNVITVRLNETQMKKYHEGKVFTLKASDINNLENHEVRLHFNAKKHLTRLVKNFHKGTGTRISPNDLIDVKVKTGDGIFDSIKGVMNSKLTKGIVKAVAPQVANIAANQIKNITGSDMAGNLTKTLINEGSKEAFGNGMYKLHGAKRVKKGGSFLQLGGSIHNENVRLANMDMMNNGVGLTATAPHFSDPTPMQRKMSELRAMRGRKNI